MDTKQLNQVLNSDRAIALEDHKEMARSFWVRLQTQEGAVEGKIHIPHKKTDKLVIFEPGFPGDGSTRLENLWLAKLLQQGYSVFAARHSGTIINGEFAAAYINCPERQAMAKRRGEKLLGLKANPDIGDWLVEPFVALDCLSNLFSYICLAGHSFGPLAAFSSLIDFSKAKPKEAKKVKRFVSLAGTLAIIRDRSGQNMRQWLEYLQKPAIQKRIMIGEPDKNIEILYQAYNKIHQEASAFPDNTELIGVSPWGDTADSVDELVPITEMLEMIGTLGRGYLIIDKTEKADRGAGRLAHDMDNLKAETFLNLVNIEWKPKSQISVINHG